ncbi:hypothetical protein RSOLAG1IB_07830 [Rhizoctonia solani AG-1 IB]|uniref:Uncharacterized protein n=1 Tax=Thanatephorus cucumeris (strain AG1-IB / isolate 7/3/14) TaxID=1108050 RepID=A0A0B7FJM8_THACB|nr:hypothetical protein RSOLAG1IB_07830 [Rhizoctonia solani AG-1 IB]
MYFTSLSIEITFVASVIAAPSSVPQKLNHTGLQSVEPAANGKVRSQGPSTTCSSSLEVPVDNLDHLEGKYSVIDQLYVPYYE